MFNNIGSSSSGNIKNDISNIKNMIDSDPIKAFEMLIETARLAGGEEAVKGLLIHARRLRDFHKEQDKEIEENLAKAALSELVNDPNSILFEHGKEQILSDAFIDGSSVVCSKCSGLIKKDRWENHLKFWCNTNDDDNANDLMMDQDKNIQASILKSSGLNNKASSTSEEGKICPKCDQFVRVGRVHLCPV